MDETLSKILRIGLLASQERDEDNNRFLSMIQRFAEVFSFRSKPAETDHVYEKLVRIIIEETDFENCSIVLWNPDAEQLRLKAAFGLNELLRSPGVKEYNQGLLFHRDEGLAGRVFRMNTPFFVEDGSLETIPHQEGAKITPASMVCLPLTDMGVLNISCSHPRRFSAPTRRNWELVGQIVSFFLNGLLSVDERVRLVRDTNAGCGNEGAHVSSSDSPPPETLPLPQQAIENTPQGICLLDAKGFILQVNQSIERRHGLRASEFEGRSPAILFSDPSEFQELLGKAATSQAQELTNVSMMAGDGGSYRADINLVRLSGAQGATGGFLLVVHDMTKRNSLAEKLVQTEKLAALGIMAGGVAHDFNNLLMAILGNIQLMMPGITDEEVHRRLQNIEKAVQDGANTVRRLQKFTERTRDSHNAPVSVDVGEAISDVMELTRPRWKNAMERSGRSIRFQLDLAPRCFASIGASDLREVLTNLVFNAVEAMPEGGLITLTCKSVRERILLQVSDTGIGMGGEVAARIFDPFYTTKGVGNSGLGLSVCWSLITRSGGDIRVQSQPGKGTVFEIDLPAAVTLPGEAQTRGAEHLKDSYSLLVIDDDPEILEILRDMLRLKGHRVTATGCAQEAIQLIRSNPYDLVLTDLGMPAVSGWEIAKQAKAKDPQLPVILITGWGAQYEEEDLTSSGVDHVLSKPLSWDRLLDTVSELLSPGVMPQPMPHLQTV
jgi:PAS domain S-box-containing protein